MPPRIAGAPAISPSAREPRQATAGDFVQRRDDREALGRVVDREADDEEGAEREFADRVGGADREALAEVVEADPDRDHHRRAARPSGRRPLAAAPLRRESIAVSARKATPAPRRSSSAPPNAPPDRGGEIERLEARVDREEARAGRP